MARERRHAQVRRWLGEQFEARHLAAAALDEPAPYEILIQASEG
jgi:hypothetical protein